MTSATATPQSVPLRNGWLIATFYFIAVLNGLNDAISHRPVVFLLLCFAASMVIGMWGIRDAANRGKPVPLFSQNWFILAGAIVVPFDMIRSRGLRGLGLVLLHVVGWNFVYWLSAITASYMSGNL